jgi:hypothetical protein
VPLAGRVGSAPFFFPATYSFHWFMKKIILSLAGAIVLICGCNKPNLDSAKIEVLSQNVDTLLRNQYITISNQFAIWREVESMKSQVTNLPTLSQMDSMSQYYCTNLQVKLQAETALIIQLNELDSQINRIAFTNNLEVLKNTYQIIDKLIDVSVCADSIRFSITNWPPVSTSDKNLMEMESEVWATKDEIHEMDHDLIKIKVQLGIPN